MSQRRKPAPPASVDLAALARAVAPLVAAQLVAALGAVGAPYSTRKGHAPEGWTDERWKAVACGIPGAYKPPGSRWTIVPRAAFEAWIASQSTPPAPTTAPTAADEPWTPARDLAALGLRRTRGEGR